MSVYISASALTIAKDLSGRQVYIYKDQPVNGAALDPEDLARLVEAGHLVELGASEEGTQGEPTTVDEILAAVGDDAEQAAAYLDAETAKDKPRKGLVEKLEAIIEKATA
jgi:hypothetical protein